MRGSYNRRYGAKKDVTHNPIRLALEGARCTVWETHMCPRGIDLVVWSPWTHSTHLLECKPDASAKLTKDEQAFIARWPGPIAVVVTPEDALAAVGVKR